MTSLPTSSWAGALQHQGADNAQTTAPPKKTNPRTGYNFTSLPQRLQT